MQTALAPMEGLVDDLLRELLTGVGGVDWCVTEFIRVTDQLLPASVYRRLAPELAHGARTPAGTPMRVQLLGSDPACLADNAAFACTLGAPVIDLNFGCPANTVNRSRGGAVLLKEPELLHRIVCEVRRAVPAEIPVTAKMRLGYETPDGALESAQALADGGASMLVVHARTKLDGYKPPAHWEWIARVQDAVTVPVFANGEIWTVEDWRRCRAISGVDDVMLGRGLVCRPDLALQIAAAREGRSVEPMDWNAVLVLIDRFWQCVSEKLPSRFAPGRIKQWLKLLTRTYPEARLLFQELKAQEHSAAVTAILAAHRHPSSADSSRLTRTMDRTLPA